MAKEVRQARSCRHWLGFALWSCNGIRIASNMQWPRGVKLEESVGHFSIPQTPEVSGDNTIEHVSARLTFFSVEVIVWTSTTPANNRCAECAQGTVGIQPAMAGQAHAGGNCEVVLRSRSVRRRPGGNSLSSESADPWRWRVKVSYPLKTKSSFFP